MQTDRKSEEEARRGKVSQTDEERKRERWAE